MVIFNCQHTAVYLNSPIFEVAAHAHPWHYAWLPEQPGNPCMRHLQRDASGNAGTDACVLRVTNTG